MSSRIEQIIEEIEEYVDSCKFQPLSSTKIVVNKEELEELLRELRMKTPDEIKRYQKIISNKDAILADAQSKADAIVAEAREKTQSMVTESEIMREATEHANNIRMGALQYTDDMLANLEKIMSHTIEGAGAKYSNFINAIQSCYDIVSKNRSELSPQAAPTNYGAPETEESEAPAYDEQQPEEN